MKKVKKETRQAKPVCPAPESNSTNQGAEAREVAVREIEFFNYLAGEVNEQLAQTFLEQESFIHQLQTSLTKFIAANFGDTHRGWRNFSPADRLLFYRDVMLKIFSDPIPDDDSLPF